VRVEDLMHAISFGPAPENRLFDVLQHRASH